MSMVRVIQFKDRDLEGDIKPEASPDRLLRPEGLPLLYVHGRQSHMT